MEFLDSLRAAWKFFGGSHVDEPWATDEAAFEEHFGASYEDFEARVASLDQAHTQLYERTLEVNPEAAITWVFFTTSLE
jgi:hypothetical protein